MISFSKKFIFMHIPKTAGTSVEASVLKPYAYFFEDERENLLMEKHFSGLMEANAARPTEEEAFLGKHFTVRDYYVAFTNSEDFDTYFNREDYVNLDSNPLDHFYKFSIVRNPWDRLVSHYLMNVEEFNEEDFSDYASLTGGLHDITDSKEYLKKPLSLNLLSQSEWLINEHSKITDFDKIIRYESLDEGFEQICQDLDIDHEPLPHLNKSEGKKHYSEYYNEDTKQMVAEGWAEDIKNFGYEYEAV